MTENPLSVKRMAGYLTFCIMISNYEKWITQFKFLSSEHTKHL